MSNDESSDDNTHGLEEDNEEEGAAVDAREQRPKITMRDEDVDFTPTSSKMARSHRNDPMYSMSDGLIANNQNNESQSFSKPRSRRTRTNPDSNENRQRAVHPPRAIIRRGYSVLATVKYYGVMLIFAMICVFSYHFYVTHVETFRSFSFNPFVKKNQTENVFVPHKLINYMPAAKCYPVSPEEFLYYKSDKEWDNVLQSMMHYMTVEEYDSISAFHVGHASCFMMMRQEDGSILKMFNPNFKGYHDTVYVRVNEVSVACPQITRVVERANTVIVTYNEYERGELVIERFNNSQAWTVQATGFYLKGKTTCDTGKSNTDNGRATLKEEIEKQNL